MTARDIHDHSLPPLDLERDEEHRITAAWIRAHLPNQRTQSPSIAERDADALNLRHTQSEPVQPPVSPAGREA